MSYLQRVDLSQILKGKLISKSIDATLLEHLSATDIPRHFNGTYADLPSTTVVFDLADSSISIRQKGAIAFALEYQNMFRQLSNIIYMHEGIIEKFPGDGISIHFVQYENQSPGDSIVRALKAIREMDSYLRREMQLTRRDFRFSMAYGSDTIVTKIGNDQHDELITIGHAVNVAHKLEKYIKTNRCFLGMDNHSAHYCIKNGYFELRRYILDSNLRTDPESDEYWYGAAY